MNKYFKKIGSTEHISLWESKVLPSGIIKPPATSNGLAPKLRYVGNKIRVKFNGSSLKQEKLHILMEQ